MPLPVYRLRPMVPLPVPRHGPGRVVTALVVVAAILFAAAIVGIIAAALDAIRND